MTTTSGDLPPLKIHIIETGDNSYCATIGRGGDRKIINGATFDEMLGAVAAAMLRPHDVPYIRTPKPWDDQEPHFGMTRDQYEELLLS